MACPQKSVQEQVVRTRRMFQGLHVYLVPWTMLQQKEATKQKSTFGSTRGKLHRFDFKPDFPALTRFRIWRVNSQELIESVRADTDSLGIYVAPGGERFGRYGCIT